ncbi:hydantoinase/oxoprolinase family protein [Azoarcus sp. KH32C]|uniref:caprolactamase subunit alpha n=1 Tax=Azoarcus sp. KH32C TaxID=748247 RepID=UPI0002385D4B|nr:hydantoinase/oxoprolinase family protein [Azoarcus sp. KH32C]BAL27532.1 5-oxoprolinase (ATP-hydrolyzing), subunit A [Azoarcus sp. KH32C]
MSSADPVTYRLGIDTGGTFTDFVLADNGGRTWLFKVESTPDDPKRALAAGFRQIEEALGLGARALIDATELCVNGTTIALNALIQHSGAKVGLLTTAGHEDSLEIRLGQKEEGYRYNPNYPPARMLVERYLRRPVRERVTSDGSVLTPLNENDVAEACAFFRDQGVEAVAISFVWSCVNAAHEQRAAEIVRELLPDVYVSIGSDVLPQIREYTRTSTAVLNAYLGPSVAQYVRELEGFFAEYEGASRLRYFQSNGGMASPGEFTRRAVYAVNSGPAAAPRAGTFVARPLGVSDIITVDMGGTSFDVTLCHAGRANIAKNVDFLRYRLGIPVIQVEMLGAGGGSIAAVDRYGMLSVGPQSAGVNPGPACYRRGGERPTVTDANVVLGYLNPQALLGGRLPIDAGAARTAIARHIAEPLGISVEKAAYGVVRVVNTNMVAGIRRVSVERGYDPRDFSLVAAGGATGAHITALASEIGIRQVLVPKLASGLCAFGQVLSDVKYSYMAACPGRLDEHTDFLRLEWLFQDIEAEGLRVLRNEGFTDDMIRIERSLDMRYVGQIQECTVPAGKGRLLPESAALLRQRFDEIHQRLFTFCEPDSPVEIVNIESTVYGLFPDFPVCGHDDADASADPVKAWRKVYLGQGDDIVASEVPVYDGERIRLGHAINGPALIEEPTTTILLEAGWQAVLEPSGVYRLTDCR